MVTPTSYGYLEGADDAENAAASGSGSNASAAKRNGQYFVGDAAGPSVYRAGQTVHNPLRDGVIEDWPAVERIVEGALRTQMRLGSLEEHPLLISEPTWQSKENRERWTELAFEGWGAPAFYSVDKNVLTSFSVGKGTSLVLDIGEDVSSCTPIYDGFVIRKGVRKKRRRHALANTDICRHPKIPNRRISSHIIHFLPLPLFKPSTRGTSALSHQGKEDSPARSTCTSHTARGPPKRDHRFVHALLSSASSA